MKKFVPLCAGVAMLATSSVASAFQSQPSTYSMRHPNSNTSNTNFRNQYESRVVMRMEDQPQQYLASAKAVAECVVRKAKDKTGDLIGGPLTKDPEFKRLAGALTGRYKICYQDVGNGLPIVVLNGVLAEEVLRADALALPRFATPKDEAEARAFYAGSGDITIDSVARCLSVYSPGLVNTVLQTGVGTPAEAAALETLYAETPACNVRTPPKNVPSIEQRSALAVGLYSWTHRG